ncbi:hypothetical protein SAMD00019534_111280 [Acytostelium subglobosum LB1]|uniref:hypothetical protein n=1 Tax=Acytostelium subglobosum LB1 TaxID=1410327 RepID=UPI00064488AC|nr:hypothetical protein SAMD00019534_111280 [Acytostelium subglobosum LB1]GAM27952.1 hypothetical protein SAMD00019534_111280 [Acytostelium subglobosum LB1]|eukprot:XP_012749235.1 hypothetical protein SAMD00019534_111280 [Acytostelium subglobosum LB1]
MASVLVLGATGAIGFEVALEFLRNGYTVYGLTRSEDKAKELFKNEIIPVIGAVSDFDKWIPIAEKVKVVIEAVADFENLATAQSIADKLKVVKAKNTGLAIIFTSGALVYGSSDSVINETTPYNPMKNPLVEAKVQLENHYRQIGGIVIQPVFVFGKKGSASSIYFGLVAKNTDGNFQLYGEEGQWRSFVHLTDLANLYYLAASKHASVSGEVFIGVSYYHKTVEVVRAIAKEAKKEVKSITFVSPVENPLSQILSVSSASSHQKASTLLGWFPTQPSIIETPTRYYNSWVNNNSQ